MSAFVVQPEHIDVMVWIGSQPAGHIGSLRWYFGNPARMNELRADTRDQVGQILAG
jgi:hypothetical protein